MKEIFFLIFSEAISQQTNVHFGLGKCGHLHVEEYCEDKKCSGYMEITNTKKRVTWKYCNDDIINQINELFPFVKVERLNWSYQCTSSIHVGKVDQSKCFSTSNVPGARPSGHVSMSTDQTTTTETATMTTSTTSTTTTPTTTRRPNETLSTNQVRNLDKYQGNEIDILDNYFPGQLILHSSLYKIIWQRNLARINKIHKVINCGHLGRVWY